ncbi:Crp/Fnr family transcriptional regulator [Flavitalea flava]
MEELIELISQFAPLSPRLNKHLRKIIKFRKYKKGAFILREKEICNQIIFIKKGLLRSYSMLGDEEVSNWFMKEGDFVISIASFFWRLPAEEAIQALEDVECFCMAYGDLEDTYKQYISYERNGRLIASHYYCLSELRAKALRRQTPFNKYVHLMKNYPELVLRVPKKHIASYLDVGIRTLYSIQKKYTLWRKGKK